VRASVGYGVAARGRGGGFLPYRSPYAMRRTAISLALASGISLFEVSQFTGTSPEVIAKHCGRLTRSSALSNVVEWKRPCQQGLFYRGAEIRNRDL